MENKHNAAIKALHTITDRILQTPPLTQVEDVKKKVRFKDIDNAKERISTWPKRKVKREHRKESKEARKLIINERQRAKVQRKRMKRREKTHQGTLVVDSGATSTCIRNKDAKEVEELDEKSDKVFLCANGTTSDAANKAKLTQDEASSDGCRYCTRLNE